jgi:hypothetical protein
VSTILREELNAEITRRRDAERQLMKPKRLSDKQSREDARCTRDQQWAFMEKVARLGTLWVCWWNKDRHHPRAGAPEDLEICGLIDGCELLDWLNSHREWWVIGEWSEERYAAPVQLTEVGRVAFAQREQYDMEPLHGGLVEPGFIVTPAAMENKP